MIIRYDKDKLTRITDDIFNLTGISISVLDTELSCLTNSSPAENYCKLLQAIDGEQPRCAECDKMILDRCRRTGKLERHICRAGLYDSAMPIIKQGAVAGFVIMGQVRSEGSPPSAPAIGVSDSESMKKLSKAYSEAPFLSEKQLTGLYDLLPCILFDSAIDTVHDSLINEAVEFIETELNKRLTVKDICERFHVSKNRLYEVFHTNLGCTVTEYINTRRIAEAQSLLKESDMTVHEIAQAVGVDNYTYFCKLFKKTSGVTPSEYRRKN